MYVHCVRGSRFARRHHIHGDTSQPVSSNHPSTPSTKIVFFSPPCIRTISGQLQAKRIVDELARRLQDLMDQLDRALAGNGYIQSLPWKRWVSACHASCIHSVSNERGQCTYGCRPHKP